MYKGSVSKVMQLKGSTYRKLGPIKHPLVMGSMTLKGTMAPGLLFFTPLLQDEHLHMSKRTGANLTLTEIPETCQRNIFFLSYHR